MIRTDQVGEAYARFVKAAKSDLKGSAATHDLRELVGVSIAFLRSQGAPKPLKSRVPGKNYIGFVLKSNQKKLSRPVNSELFAPEVAEKHIDLLGSPEFSHLTRAERQSVLYTGATVFCCANDLIRQDDRKTPGSFFEYYIGHLVARTFDVNPDNEIKVLNLDMEASLPTDLIFDLGKNKNKIHLPVKLSTRERVIQVWAHQRVLDGVYGTNRFKGVLVCLTETNLKRESGEVVEICLPDQWTIYQMFIAQLARIYYLDPPTVYRRLADKYPFIKVTSFADFFDEQALLTTGGAGV